MKVLLVNRFFFPDESATSQLATDLMSALADAGLEAHVVNSRLNHRGVAPLFPCLEEAKGVRIHRVHTTRFGRQNLLGRSFDYVSFYASSLWKLWRLVSRGDVVIAMTDPPLISVIALIVVKMRRAHLINWVQDVFPEVGTVLGVPFLGGRIGNFLRVLRNHSLRSARMNVVLGDTMRSVLMDEGVAPESSRTIHNWTDDHAISPIEPIENCLRREWGLERKFVVGYSGNLGRAHEFATILAAAADLESDERVIFLLIGSGAKLQELRSVAANLRNVCFQPLQPRNRLALTLSAIDLHLISLLPALEGYIVPSKFYGAAAAGRPIVFIGNRDGEIGKLVRRHDCGKAIEAGDHDELVTLIRDVARNPALAARWGENARHAVEREFSKEAALLKWRNLIESCLG